jgi:hypothetical protein
MLGNYLGAIAKNTDRRVLFSPFFNAKKDSSISFDPSDSEIAQFLSCFWQAIPDERFYPRQFSLNKDVVCSPSFSIEKPAA